MAEILHEAMANLEVAIRESRAIVTSDRLPMVRVDRTQLVQVLQNLISNAIKYRSERTPKIHVSARDLGLEWQISVRDNGIGIAPQYADRIFKIFQRLHTRKDYPGTGIGLAVCKKVIERHGGRIWVESEPEEGSTLPSDAFLTREALKDAPRPDLILLDLNLPRKDGRQVLAELKNDPNLLRIPVVVLTSSSAETDIRTAYDLHANGYVAKPSDFVKFREAIREIESFWFHLVRMPPR